MDININVPLLDACSRTTGFKKGLMWSDMTYHVRKSDEIYENCDLLLKTTDNKAKGFQFDGTYLSLMLRRGLKDRDKIMKCVTYILNETNKEYGFSGKKPYSSSDNDIQSSSLFGHWLKAAALSLNINRIGNDFVLNERGHLLESRRLLNFSKEFAPAQCSITNSDAYQYFC